MLSGRDEADAATAGPPQRCGDESCRLAPEHPSGKSCMSLAWDDLASDHPMNCCRRWLSALGSGQPWAFPLGFSFLVVKLNTHCLVPPLHGEE